jgi:N-acetylglucosaminyl-diphospho-decaprenol L-rhamnosyltransferase
MRICLSIVSHGQADLVDALLRSVDEFVVSEEHEVLVVITENTTAQYKCTCKYPVDYTFNLRQKGFGANHNAAFERTTPDYFLVINPDITFKGEFCLDHLVSAMTVSNVDLTSPIITDKFGETVDYKRADLTLINLIKRRVFKQTERCFDWYAGMFLVFTGKSYLALEGFDPRFFLYVEDCDICVRAARLGYQIEDVVNVSVQHDSRRASSNLFSIYYFWHLSSLLKYWLKRESFKTFGNHDK